MPSNVLQIDNTRTAQQGTRGSGPGLPSTAAPAAADPTYLAYLRGAGVDEANLYNVLGNRVGALTRDLGRKLPAYADRRERAVESAGNAAESRGFFRSGVRMRDQNRAAIDVDRERMDYEAGIRDEIADLYGVNAMDVAAIRRKLAEEGITGSQAVAVANANAGLY